MEPWLPLVISGVIFVLLLVIFRIARAYWAYSLPISFILAVFCLVAVRRFQPTKACSGSNDPPYEVDAWYIIEASAMSLAIITMLILLIVVGCKANPQAKFCVCCRLQSQIQGPVPYESVIFQPAGSEIDIYVDH